MKYYFSMRLSYEEFLPYYQGKVQSVVVTCTTGERVQFPAMHMRKFVTSGGISGYFCLETQNNKFLSLSKIR